jgi:hypothetical protein
MNEKTWALIDEQYIRFPETRASAVSITDFVSAMKPYGQLVDPDYREFILRYGGGIVGPHPIYGLRKAKSMGMLYGKGTAPELTQAFRDMRWPGVNEWLIFSVDHGGNPIGFAKDQTVWLSDQMDYPQIVKMASGFEDYLLKWCFKVRKVEDY